MKNKLLLLSLAVLLMLMFACTALASDYEYTVDENGCAVITKYTGYDRKVVIPAEIDGHTVGAIGAFTFFDKGMTSVSIPDSVTSIGANPFRHCKNLSSVIVSPDHPVLATIDGVLFEKPTKTLIWYPMTNTQTSYAIPQGIASIGDYAFHQCDSLTSVSIPDSVTSIGNYAFYSCDSLTSISIPDSVTSIGDSAFSFCSSLTSISIPDSVTSIGANPFRYCNSLSSVIVSIDHPVLATIDGVLFNKATKTLIWYPMTNTQTSYAIPQGIVSIGDNAFWSYSSLTSISIPDSVTSIGDSAFSSCESLTSISIPDSVTSIGNGAFYGCNNLTLTVSRDSYAHQYCIDNNLRFTYPDALDWLNN